MQFKNPIPPGYRKPAVLAAALAAAATTVALSGTVTYRVWIKAKCEAAPVDLLRLPVTIDDAVHVINRQEWAPGQHKAVTALAKAEQGLGQDKEQYCKTPFFRLKTRAALKEKITADEKRIPTLRAKLRPNTKYEVVVAAKHAALKMEGKLDPGPMANLTARDLFVQSVVTARLESAYTYTAKASAHPFAARGAAQVQGREFFTILIRHHDELKTMGLGNEYKDLLAAMDRTLESYAAGMKTGGSIRQRRSLIAADPEYSYPAIEQASVEDKAVILNALLDDAPLAFGREQTTKGAFLSFFIASHLYNEPVGLPDDLVKQYGRATLLYIKHQRGSGSYRRFIGDLRAFDAAEKRGDAEAFKAAYSSYCQHSYRQSHSNLQMWRVPAGAQLPHGLTCTEQPGIRAGYSTSLKLPRDVLYGVYKGKTELVSRAAEIIADEWVVPEKPHVRLGERQNRLYFVREPKP